MPSVAMMRHIHQNPLWPVTFLAFASWFKRGYYHRTKQPRNTGYQNKQREIQVTGRRDVIRPVSLDHVKCNFCCWREQPRSKQDIHTGAKKTSCQSHRERAKNIFTDMAADTVESQLWQHLLSVVGFLSNPLQQVQSIICIYRTSFPNLWCWLWNVAPEEEQQLLGANYNIMDLKWLNSQAFPSTQVVGVATEKQMFSSSSADFKQCFSKQAPRERKKKVKKKYIYIYLCRHCFKLCTTCFIYTPTNCWIYTESHLPEYIHVFF